MAFLCHFGFNMLPQQNILHLPIAPLKTLCNDTNKKALPTALWIHSIISSVLFESAGQETKMEHEPIRTSPQTMQGKGEKGTPAAIGRLYKKKAKIKDTCTCLKTLQSQRMGEKDVCIYPQTLQHQVPKRTPLTGHTLPQSSTNPACSA